MSLRDELLRHFDAVRAYCFQQCHDPHLADDVAQETMLTALARWDSLRERNRLRGWLFRIAQRRLVDAARRRALLPLLEEPLAPAPAGRPPEEVRKEAGRALRRLPLALRRPVRMHYMQGRPLREVARVCRTTVNGIKARLYRARRLMRGDVG